MGKIVKSMQLKHRETLPRWLITFVIKGAAEKLHLLPQHLSKFKSRWPFLRGDLYHWIPLLNRFDTILDDFCQLYGLQDGPQTRDFGCELVRRGSGEDEQLDLAQWGFGEEGDRQLVECILDFSRMLLENCGNRSIYASSSHLNSLLNTTSLPLLAKVLLLSSHLAQRYQASIKRVSANNRHISLALLSNHYNINLDKVLQISLPFVKSVVKTDSAVPSTPVTPGTKGKDKSYFTLASGGQKIVVGTKYASDLVAIARGTSTLISNQKGSRQLPSAKPPSPNADDVWTEWGDIRFTYNTGSAGPDAEAATVMASSNLASTNPPNTPTPIRRSSTLGQSSASRTGRPSGAEDLASTSVRQVMANGTNGQAQSSKVLEISTSKIMSTPIHQVLKEYLPILPVESRNEFLARLRVAYAMTSTLQSRQQMLAIRILAITNLAWIHGESALQEKVLKQDNEEPRRLKLVYQLTELIHPPAEGLPEIPRTLQTIAMSALHALAQHTGKHSDVCSALNTHLNHGVILYVIRKAVAEMNVDDSEDVEDRLSEDDEWRNALFTLLQHVVGLLRAGQDLIGADIIPILVELLTLRTKAAERYASKVLALFDGMVYNVREAFQSLISANGLDVISDLIIYEVTSATESLSESKDLPTKYRSHAQDFDIPFFKQITLKWVFKFIHRMMSTAGGYGGNFDRLLRNLIDSSQLLASLKEIMSHGRRFGSSVWTSAVSILNDFIHNEPTSFAVIAEAGLSRGLMEAVTGKPIQEGPSPDSNKTTDEASSSPAADDEEMSEISEIEDEEEDITHPPSTSMLESEDRGPLATGILPSVEAINIIPQAFGAICLNNSGLRMLQRSNALSSFFEIFESPEHVRCLESDIDISADLAASLGAAFDELFRHHPPLKMAIVNATLDTVARVGYLCKTKAADGKAGASIAAIGSGKDKAKERGVDDDVEMKSSQDETVDQLAFKTPELSVDSYVNALVSFLHSMFSNSTLLGVFMENGGVEHVLDLAELPSLSNDFTNHQASHTLSNVISTLADHKPHLVMPSLLKRTQLAIDSLSFLTKSDSSESYFASLVTEKSPICDDTVANGTSIVKALLKVHIFTGAIQNCLPPSGYHHRSSTPMGFQNTNVTDYYVRLVKSLGELLGAATRQGIALQMAVPDRWRRATRSPKPRDGADGKVTDIDGYDELTPRRIEGHTSTEGASQENLAEPSAPNLDSEAPDSTADKAPQNPEAAPITQQERDTPQFQNYQTLRFLLCNMEGTISPLLQRLGRALAAKRNPEPYYRQNHILIAEAIAEAVLQQLIPVEEEPNVAAYSAWSVLLDTVKDILVDVSRHKERLLTSMTLVIQAFKDRKGFETLEKMLKVFSRDIIDNKPALSSEESSNVEQRKVKLGFATICMRKILGLYSVLVNGKNILESPQTQAIISRSDRDRSRPDNYLGAQFLVELRMSILPVVRSLWESEIAEISAPISDKLIEIIRAIAFADGEAGAFKRSEKPPMLPSSPRKSWRANPDGVTKLKNAGYSADLAKEALYRCSNSIASATEYCKAQKTGSLNGRHPIPAEDVESSQSPGPHARTPTGTSTPDVSTMAVDGEAAAASTSAPERPATQSNIPPSLETADINSIISNLTANLEEAIALPTTFPNTTDMNAAPKSPVKSSSAATPAQVAMVTVDDLNDERAAVRKTLIDRCLDVINVHGSITFEIGDLISTVVNNSPDSSSMRKDVGETLVNALMSFAVEENFETVGNKVAAYAHLLAIMLQDKAFYEASIEELTGNLSTLLGFVKLAPNHGSDESSPWIANILIIVEKLLIEDAQPLETTWRGPTNENDTVDEPIFKFREQIVDVGERSRLFEAILEIMPRVGKDEPLALAVLRILVILTRTRSKAKLMGEKKNIQRLFVMAKQLAGANSGRLQSPLMLILRHIIEDEVTLKRIMKSDIITFFASPYATQRPVDVQAFMRSMSSQIIRAPEIFVEAANEVLKLSMWSANMKDYMSRSLVALKADASHNATTKAADGAVTPTVQATEDLSINDARDNGPSTKSVEDNSNDKSKAQTSEQKTPVVENPDGVIHFLLWELMNYKEVEDKEPTTNATSTDKTSSDIVPESSDETMTDVSAEASPLDSKQAKKSKQDFKPDDHPIYVYRCLLLQCLTELLSSYNRTKIEFINFKRSATPLPMTPSKPRSTVINYLLSDLIPLGTLDHAETNSLRKRFHTSSWADSVIVALLSKTGEQNVDMSRDLSDGEDEPDLLFVRKFVLENILKSFKDASSSPEALDARYARMLALADLMSHIMNGRDNHTNSPENPISSRSQQQLRRLMFEKGFINALTNSIADIDLNFSGAKRAVKYILRPLKTLTSTAIILSALSLATTPGQTDEDEIASASSVSDIADQREETPDLFRNSTLGMFEPGRDHRSSSESEDDGDEEMYEGEFDDEMDYEEEGPEDDEDSISDEDDEIEGMGPIEGLSGDVQIVMNDLPEDNDEDSDDGSDDDDDDDESSDMDDDNTHDIDVIIENGDLGDIVIDDEEDDDEDNEDVEDEEDEWQSDDEDDEADLEDFEGATGDLVDGPPLIDQYHSQLGQLARVFGTPAGADGAIGMLQRIEDEVVDPEDGQMEVEYRDDGQDEDEDEEEEDDMDEEDMMYDDYAAHDHAPNLPLSWDDEAADPPIVLTRGGHHHHHHHHHHRNRRPQGVPVPVPIFPGNHRDPLVVPFGRTYRSHRPDSASRNNDDGINPLLQRSDNASASGEGSSRPGPMGNWIPQNAGSGIVDLRNHLPFGDPSAIINEFISAFPPAAIGRDGHALHLTLNTRAGNLAQDFQALFGMARDTREARRSAPEGDLGFSAFVAPQATAYRWGEEAKMLFGSSVNEKASRIANSLMAALIPLALEQQKKAKAEAEIKRKAEEEKENKRLAEIKVQKEKEAAEKAAQDQKEAEERDALQRENASENVVESNTEENSQEIDHSRESSDNQAMEGVETTGDQESSSAAVEESAAADRPRAMVNIRGSQFDITDLGIDAEFLRELPEEIREEVIMSTVAERRSQAAAGGAQPSDIDREFLDALPADIRDEIIQQENQDRRRREREEQRRQAAANTAASFGGNAEGHDMDAASILATFPPELRQQVLMEQDEEMIAQLPPDLAAQARALNRDHPMHRAHHTGNLGRPRIVDQAASGADNNLQRPQRHSTVQMLDKSGIATLLRLMFVLQQGSLRSTLCAVLQNISENKYNRAEVISVLLHILQDGSADVTAVDRSFAQLSLRAKQSREKEPKTPQPLKRSITGTDIGSVTAASEVTPLMVAQQCLSTLVFLCLHNRHIAPFFLTEHESASGLKRSMSRKGKGKDLKASKYALNSLLGLLDRSLITESSTAMEFLSDLLNRITQPLQALERKQKEASNKVKASDTEPADPAVPASAEELSSTEAAVPSAGPESSTIPSAQDNAGPETANDDVAATTNQAAAEEESNDKHQEQKQVNALLPPVIPEYNLKLVINIFVAQECSAKTFRETISTIKNLSAIPGAKSIFGAELVRKTQELGESILLDLNELLPQIEKASTGTEIQGVALASFSQTSSDQNKLLRVLTALDHLFDPKSLPKRDETAGDATNGGSESSKQTEKQDLLSTLYQNTAFGPMWEKLSACLSAIRQREHMLNVATILLPLIESLMVVCKNTTTKENATSLSQSKEISLNSPAPEARMEDLFYTFTEEHRKILNDLVRHNPKLMSGTFSLLVKNPKVLEFDNKRNYFTRSVHNRNSQTRQSYPPLQLSVNRGRVFFDSYKSFYYTKGDEIKYGKLSIRFIGEDGVDAGGVTREWFQILSRQMFDQDYALFIPVSSDRTTFHPNMTSSIDPEHLAVFKFIGRIIGKALYEGRVLDCHFSRAVYKRILGKSVSVKDMESLDPDYYKSLIWMLENDITDIITETFSVDNDKFGIVETVDLIENGRNVPVTQENKHEYVRLVVEFKLISSVREQLDSFLGGFNEIIPAELIEIFNEQELELLISGLPEIDVDDWKSNTEYQNYTGASPQIQWFWRAVRSFDKEERAKLLQFVTGTSKVPLNGFKELEGMNGFSRFNIHRDYGNKDRLPSSHTCFNQLDIPEYESYEILRQQVIMAITAGSEYFGFA